MLEGKSELADRQIAQERDRGPSFFGAHAAAQVPTPTAGSSQHGSDTVVVAEAELPPAGSIMIACLSIREGHAAMRPGQSLTSSGTSEGEALVSVGCFSADWRLIEG
ncbi:hypothetical protein GCM10010350_07590 [Streptomyces galilaeus]|nr:hypothetical protein GCM10010350_07590 [Streptomyces galilaeus]